MKELTLKGNIPLICYQICASLTASSRQTHSGHTWLVKIQLMNIHVQDICMWRKAGLQVANTSVSE